MPQVCSYRLCMSTVTKAFTGISRNLHIIANVFSLDNLHLLWKTHLLVGDMLVNFRDILSETSKAVHAGIWVGIST